MINRQSLILRIMLLSVVSAKLLNAQIQCADPASCPTYSASFGANYKGMANNAAINVMIDSSLSSGTQTLTNELDAVKGVTGSMQSIASSNIVSSVSFAIDANCNVAQVTVGGTPVATNNTSAPIHIFTSTDLSNVVNQNQCPSQSADTWIVSSSNGFGTIILTAISNSPVAGSPNMQSPIWDPSNSSLFGPLIGHEMGHGEAGLGHASGTAALDDIMNATVSTDTSPAFSLCDGMAILAVTDQRGEDPSCGELQLPCAVPYTGDCNGGLVCLSSGVCGCEDACDDPRCVGWQPSCGTCLYDSNCSCGQSCEGGQCVDPGSSSGGGNSGNGGGNNGSGSGDPGDGGGNTNVVGQGSSFGATGGTSPLDNGCSANSGCTGSPGTCSDGSTQQCSGGSWICPTSFDPGTGGGCVTPQPNYTCGCSGDYWVCDCPGSPFTCADGSQSECDGGQWECPSVTTSTCNGPAPNCPAGQIPACQGNTWYCVDDGSNGCTDICDSTCSDYDPSQCGDGGNGGTESGGNPIDPCNSVGNECPIDGGQQAVPVTPRPGGPTL